jgi:replicative DNA helicase
VEIGTVNLLAAPPGCYKTSAMLRLARGFVEQGHRVTWLAAEMKQSTLVRRMVCQAARLGQAAIASKAMPPEHAERIDGARARLAALGDRLEFVAAPIGFEELERAADGARVVFVDYLQLVRHPRPEVRGHERIEEVMAKIAELSQRTNAVFVVSSSQGRDGGDGEQERHIHNATKGSSSIEYSADALWCAGRPMPSNDGLTVKFKCLKQREGERRNLLVPIDEPTGLVAEEVRP